MSPAVKVISLVSMIKKMSLILALIAAMLLSANSQEPVMRIKPNAYREYFTDVEQLHKVSAAIKIARLKNIGNIYGFRIFEQKFYLVDKDGINEASFQSKRLLDLYKAIHDRAEFLKMLSRSSAYGFEKGERFEAGREGKQRKIQIYKVKVLIAVFCSTDRCDDEEYMVFLSDPEGRKDEREP